MIRALFIDSENYQALFMHPEKNDKGEYVGGELVAQGESIAKGFIQSLEFAEQHGILHSTEIRVRDLTDEERAELEAKGAISQRGV